MNKIMVSVLCMIGLGVGYSFGNIDPDIIQVIVFVLFSPIFLFAGFFYGKILDGFEKDNDEMIVDYIKVLKVITSEQLKQLKED